MYACKIINQKPPTNFMENVYLEQSLTYNNHAVRMHIHVMLF